MRHSREQSANREGDEIKGDYSRKASKLFQELEEGDREEGGKDGEDNKRAPSPVARRHLR